MMRRFFSLLILMWLGERSFAMTEGEESKPSKKPRIIGGIEAKAWEFPGVVVVDGRCTGTLIAPDWVLTAARCARDASTDVKSYVYGGAVFWKSGIKKKVIRTEIHPYFKRSRPSWDLALLQLDSPFTLNSNISVQRLCWNQWDWDYFYHSHFCTMVGFGSETEKGVDLSDRRYYQYATAKYGNRACPNCFEEHRRKDMLCLNPPEERVNPCTGDTGGPLICDDLQVGVASGWTDESCYYPKTCTDPDTTYVYAYLCPSLPWIRMHVKTLRTYLNSAPPRPLSAYHYYFALIAMILRIAYNYN